MDASDADPALNVGNCRNIDLATQERLLKNYTNSQKQRLVERTVKSLQKQKAATEITVSLEAQIKNQTDLQKQYEKLKGLFANEKKNYNEWNVKVSEVEKVVNLAHDKIKTEKRALASEAAAAARAQTFSRRLLSVVSGVKAALARSEADTSHCIAQLQRELSQRREQNKTLSSNFFALKANQSDLTNKYSAEMSVAKQALKDLSAEEKTVNDELINLQNDCGKKEEKLQEMQVDFKKFKTIYSEDICKDTGQIEERYATIKEQKKEIHTWKEELFVEEKMTEELRGEIPQLQEEALLLRDDSANDEVDQLEEELKKLQKEWNAILDEVKHSKEKIKHNKKLMQERKKELEMKKNELNTMGYRMTFQCQYLKEREKSQEHLRQTLLQLIANEQENTTEAVATLHKEIQAERVILHTASLAEEDLNKTRAMEISKIEEAISGFMRNEQAMSGKMEDLKQKLVDVSNSSNEIVKKNADKLNEIERTAKQSEIASEELRALEEKNMQLEKDFNQFTEELNKATLKKANLEAALAEESAEMRAEAETREREKAELEKRCDRTGRQHSEELRLAWDEVAHNQKELETLKLELSALSAEYRQQVSAAQEKVTKNEEAVERMRKDLQQSASASLEHEANILQLQQREQALRTMYNQKVIKDTSQKKEEAHAFQQFKKPLRKIKQSKAQPPSILKPKPATMPKSLITKNL